MHDNGNHVVGITLGLLDVVRKYVLDIYLEWYLTEKNGQTLTLDHVTKSLAASPRLQIRRCSMTSSGISRFPASRQRLFIRINLWRNLRKPTFNQCPTRLAAWSITAQSNVGFEIGYYSCSTVQSLLGHALEEKVHRLNETPLCSRGRCRNDPLI